MAEFSASDFDIICRILL